MEPTCEGCPCEYDDEYRDPWVEHLMMLNDYVDAGCSFRLDDLKRDEWTGLIILRQEKARHIEETIKRKIEENK